MLQNTRGYRFYHFWVIKRTPTGRYNYTPPLSIPPRLGLINKNQLYIILTCFFLFKWNTFTQHYLDFKKKSWVFKGVGHLLYIYRFRFIIFFFWLKQLVLDIFLRKFYVKQSSMGTFIMLWWLLSGVFTLNRFGFINIFWFR